MNMGKFFVKFRVQVLVIISIGGLWLGMGIKNLKVDTNPDNYFPESSRVRVANAKIGEAFGGSTQMSILIEGDIFDPEILKNIEMLTDHIKTKHDIVTKSYSIADVIKKMHSGFNAGDPTFEVIPNEKDLLLSYQ